MITSRFKFLSLLVVCFAWQNISAQCNFTGLGPNYCLTSPTVQLVPLSSGGNFAGPGVVGSVFNPALAGPGTHTISYGTCAAGYSVSQGTYSPYASSSGTSVGGSGSGSVERGATVNLLDDQITN